MSLTMNGLLLFPRSFWFMPLPFGLIESYLRMMLLKFCKTIRNQNVKSVRSRRDLDLDFIVFDRKDLAFSL